MSVGVEVATRAFGGLLGPLGLTQVGGKPWANKGCSKPHLGRLISGGFEPDADQTATYHLKCSDPLSQGSVEPDVPKTFGSSLRSVPG